MKQRTKSVIRRNRKTWEKPACSQNSFNKKGFGINEVIGIAAGIIIAAVVIIPGLEVFAGEIMGQLSDWWASMAPNILQG